MAPDNEIPYCITIMARYPHCNANLILTLNQRVVGSNPTAPTIFLKKIRWLLGRGVASGHCAKMRNLYPAIHFFRHALLSFSASAIWAGVMDLAARSLRPTALCLTSGSNAAATDRLNHLWA